MKVRCIDNNGIGQKLELNKIYEGKIIPGNNIEDERWKVEGFEDWSFYKSRFEIVEEEKIGKTFKEVITNIKKYDVWESENYTVMVNWNDDFVIKRKDLKNYPINIINVDEMFKLQRKQYTFQEAFKAYEEGKEIESCGTNRVYALSREHELGGPCLYSVDEIRGKWYINEGK